jgi:hypothetical protein
MNIENENLKNSNTEAEKIEAANAGERVSDNETGNIAPSRGEIRGEPGTRRGGSGTAATGAGLRPKLGVTGSDMDGQVTDQ